MVYTYKCKYIHICEWNHNNKCQFERKGKCCMLGVIIYNRVDLAVIANLKVAMNFKIKPFGVFINLFNVVRTIANTHRTRKEVYLRH